MQVYITAVATSDVGNIVLRVPLAESIAFTVLADQQELQDSFQNPDYYDLAKRSRT